MSPPTPPREPSPPFAKRSGRADLPDAASRTQLSPSPTPGSWGGVEFGGGRLLHRTGFPHLSHLRKEKKRRGGVKGRREGEKETENLIPSLLRPRPALKKRVIFCTLGVVFHLWRAGHLSLGFKAMFSICVVTAQPCGGPTGTRKVKRLAPGLLEVCGKVGT